MNQLQYLYDKHVFILVWERITSRETTTDIETSDRDYRPPGQVSTPRHSPRAPEVGVSWHLDDRGSGENCERVQTIVIGYSTQHAILSTRDIDNTDCDIVSISTRQWTCCVRRYLGGYSQPKTQLKWCCEIWQTLFIIKIDENKPNFNTLK